MITAFEGKKSTTVILAEVEWEKLRCIAAILGPFKNATELLGGEKYTSSSVILPTFCHLLHVMRTFDDNSAHIIRFKNEFFANLTKRRNKSNLNWLKIATALNSRLKHLKCSQRKRYCVEKII